MGNICGTGSNNQKILSLEMEGAQPSSDSQPRQLSPALIDPGFISEPRSQASQISHGSLSNTSSRASRYPRRAGTMDSIPERTIAAASSQPSFSNMRPQPQKNRSIDSTMSRISDEKSRAIQRRFFSSPAASSFSGAGSVASGSKTGSAQLPSDFKISTNVSFGAFPALHELRMPEMSDTGLEYILDAFRFSEDYSASFDKELEIHGLTMPGEDPQIGRAAFEKVVVPPGLGVSVELNDNIVALQVALTIAHECSHVDQFEKLELLDLAGKDDKVVRAGARVASIVNTAQLHQTNLLETLGYHSEVYNLACYIENVYLSPAEKDQMHALRDVAVHQRDFHFFQLPYPVVEVLITGEVKQAMDMVLNGVPPEFLSRAT